MKNNNVQLSKIPPANSLDIKITSLLELSARCLLYHIHGCIHVLQKVPPAKCEATRRGWLLFVPCNAIGFFEFQIALTDIPVEKQQQEQNDKK